MNLFCTAKNTLVITLQFYRLMVVQIEAAEAAKKEAQKAKKKGQVKNPNTNTKNRFQSSFETKKKTKKMFFVNVEMRFPGGVIGEGGGIMITGTAP